MNLGITAIAVSAAMYVIVCGSCIKQKDYPHALMWFSYAMANMGLLWYELNKMKIKLEDAAAESAVLAGLCQYGIDAMLEIEYISTEHFMDQTNQVIFDCLEEVS